MVVLYCNKKKMSTIYDNMMANWKSKKSNEELDIMIKSGRKGKQFSLICLIMGHVTITARLVQCIFENLPNWNSPVHLRNFTLYVDAYFPFRWNYSPTFEIICCLQYIGTVCGTIAYTGTDSFFSQLSFHYTAQYHILRLRLLHLINNFNNAKIKSKFNEKFNNIINFHHQINSCIEIIESTFHLMFLVQLLACTFQICLQAYFFILFITHENHSSMISEILFIVVFFMYIIGNFYIYCYLTEMLQMESYAFADTAYETEWFNLPSQKAKSLLLLMRSGNKPVQITAGKFVVFNFQLFGSIIKTSMGYLSFLITMRKSN
ncbi:odorant receptor 4-like [Leptopilina boulardi]|uniref:odorant receptor 4-like n=1 Tax=Leptopilina boulardi TaxID=63433 RepID=UPI0021F654BB|nr:odorant receptor 4-like [Leptopilina boulardi]